MHMRIHAVSIVNMLTYCCRWRTCAGALCWSDEP